MNRYSSNQHVDRGLTYHFASWTPMWQATRSKICFRCVCCIASSSAPRSSSVMRERSKHPSSNLLLIFLLCARRPPIASAEAISMCIIATHMSMLAAIMGRTDAICSLGIESLFFARCRGMLAVPSAARSPAVHGAGGDCSSEGHSAGKCSPVRAGHGGNGGEAGTSRAHGRGGIGEDSEEVGAWTESD